MRVFRNSVCFALAVMVIFLSSHAFASQDKPAPPNGFSWKDVGFMKILIPDGWFTKTEEGGGTKAFFASKESIEKNGKFDTGLTVNAVKNIPAKLRVKPSEYVKSVMVNMTKTNEYKEVETLDIPPFKGYQALIRSKRPSGDFTILFLSVLGNDTTGSAFITVLESLESLWPEESKIGQIMLKSIDVDEKY
jgi:hypothetical protein